MGLTGLKSRGWQGCPLQSPEGRIHSLPLPASRGYLHSLACGPFLCLQSQQWLSKSFSGCHLCVLTQILPFVRTLVITWSPPRYSKLSPCFKVRWLAMYFFLALTYSFFFFFISLCIYWLCWVFAAVWRHLQLQRTGSLARHVCSAIVAHRFSCPVACGIFNPQPGIKSMSPVLEDKSLTTGPPRK